MAFPSVSGLSSDGGIKATGAQAGEDEDPPEDMEVDPNPAGKGLRPLHGLGVQSAGSPSCEKSTVALAAAEGVRSTSQGCVQHLWACSPALIQLPALRPLDILCTYMYTCT